MTASTLPGSEFSDERNKTLSLGNPAITNVTLQTMGAMNEKDRREPGGWAVGRERPDSIWGRSGSQGRLPGGSDIGAEVQRVSRSYQEKRWVMSRRGRGKSKCRNPEMGGTFNNRGQATWRTVDVTL